MPGGSRAIVSTHRCPTTALRETPALVLVFPRTMTNNAASVSTLYALQGLLQGTFFRLHSGFNEEASWHD
jgi:hypothetical protein